MIKLDPLGFRKAAIATDLFGISSFWILKRMSNLYVHVCVPLYIMTIVRNCPNIYLVIIPC